MKNSSRRELVTRAVGVAATLLGISLFANAQTIDEPRPFEILVVGDSMISAQGLRTENKFYYLTKEWIEKEVLRGRREVNLKTKAHSGARISLHEDELKTMARLGDDPGRIYHPEINLSFPSIEMQVKTAAR